MLNKCAKLFIIELVKSWFCFTLCLSHISVTCGHSVSIFVSHCVPFCVNLWSSFLDRFRPSLHSYFNPIMVTLNIESVIICAALCYVTHSAKRVNSFGGLY